MDVGGHGLGVHHGHAGQLRVLAHHMDAVGDHVLDGLAIDDGGFESLHVGRLGGEGRLGDLLGVGLELLVHAHEVGLAVQLDHGAGGARIVHDIRSYAVPNAVCGR